MLKTLDRLGLGGNTLVIFTSDNGGYTVNQSDLEESLRINGHVPNGPLRGGKGDLTEGDIAFPSWRDGRVKSNLAPDLRKRHR